MTTVELPKTFDSKAAEERWFQRWIDLGYFKADPSRESPVGVFSVVIPPPNITGQLHLGHALNVSLQDIIVRMRRMQGYNTLWLPGTDHAGIATQNAVEKDLAKQGKNRHQLGREPFVDRVWQWRDEYGGRILNQLRRLGASCDWSRERFTLDPGLSKAVTKVFVDLYNKELIYRAKRLINWCPRCETALSDLEVDHKESKGSLYYVRYLFSDGSGALTVATTRPETILGDTAVAVNPDDDRFTSVVGKTVRVPLIDREVKVIADAAVDREFGTGALKITPGHDLNDFEIGKRHSLEQISVLDERARINANGGKYQSLSREDARKQIVADLEAAGLLEKIEPHNHSVGVCSRCETVVEPMLSEQWFMAMKDMARRAGDAVRNGDTTFYPKFWEKTFFDWIDNIHDWCVSRQLWWGHRIPAYHCVRCDHLIVAAERPAKCPECDGSDITQDEDVLDTWFSSGLWPFSTLGWPENTADLARYYPTSLLLTGFDIIFFWVARMMMFGLEFTDQVPFRDVYITPLVRDEYGKKMTKSKGNVVDPLELMEQYGADALRFTLAQLAAQGRDVILSHDRFAASRAFANKIWNAARFVLMNLEGAAQPIPSLDESKLSLADRWILDRLNQTIVAVTGHVDKYEFNIAAMAVYDFAWHQFCDWYIELAKEPLKAGGERQAAARYVLVHVLDQMLRLLHPFMPFVTEDIWQAIRPYVAEKDLSPHLPIAKFPAARQGALLADAEALAMERCIEATEAINSLKSLLGWQTGQSVRAVVRLAEGIDSSEIELWRNYVSVRAKLENFQTTSIAGAQVVYSHLPWGDIGVAAPEGYDFDQARKKLKKQLDEVVKHSDQHSKRLNDPQFMSKADPQTREEVAERYKSLQSQHRMLTEQLKQLEGAA
jgi:valyl-tRNA synthetase